MPKNLNRSDSLYPQGFSWCVKLESKIKEFSTDITAEVRGTNHHLQPERWVWGPIPLTKCYWHVPCPCRPIDVLHSAHIPWHGACSQPLTLRSAVKSCCWEMGWWGLTIKAKFTDHHTIHLIFSKTVDEQWSDCNISMCHTSNQLARFESCRKINF